MFRHLKKAYKKGTKLWNEIPKNQKSAKEKIVDLEIIERIIKNHWWQVSENYQNEMYTTLILYNKSQYY